jgi:hypothetical protein
MKRPSASSRRPLVTKNSDLWLPVLAILFHAVIVVLAQAMLLYHLYLHCSLAMAVWTLMAVLALVLYSGGYRLVAWGWGFGERKP